MNVQGRGVTFCFQELRGQCYQFIMTSFINIEKTYVSVHLSSLEIRVNSKRKKKHVMA